MFGLNSSTFMSPFLGTFWFIWDHSTTVESIKIKVVVEKKLADIEDWEPSEYWKRLPMS